MNFSSKPSNMLKTNFEKNVCLIIWFGQKRQKSNWPYWKENVNEKSDKQGWYVLFWGMELIKLQS